MQLSLNLSNRPTTTEYSKCWTPLPGTTQHNDKVSELGILNFFEKNISFDRFHRDRGIFVAFELTNGPKTLVDCRLELAFNRIVGSKPWLVYLPRNCLEISFHLMPCLQCASKPI